ncbi:MAG: large subunit ribosomal protein L19 [Candidatus Paceibacteria bacterium]|jgi:large subunit ribosomal protein L19
MNTAIKISPVDMKFRKELGIKSGDKVRIHVKIQDKEKTRIQVFEGLVLSVKHGGEPGATFTVRKMSGKFGVERIFPLYSPVIDNIEILRRAKVRRSKLYFLRDKTSKQIRRKLRAFVDFIMPEPEPEVAEVVEAEAPAEEVAETPKEEKKDEVKDAGGEDALVQETPKEEEIPVEKKEESTQ